MLHAVVMSRVRTQSRRIVARKARLELVVFGAAELFLGDDAVAIFVLVLEDLLDHLVRVWQVLESSSLCGWELFFQVFADLVARQLLILVAVDLLEDVDGRRAVLDLGELGLEDERRTRRDAVSGARLAVAQRRGHGQLALVAHAHVEQALVPALDHLAQADLEAERLVPLAAAAAAEHETFQIRLFVYACVNSGACRRMA